VIKRKRHYVLSSWRRGSAVYPWHDQARPAAMCSMTRASALMAAE
jgi:hypothetical protein